MPTPQELTIRDDALFALNNLKLFNLQSNDFNIKTIVESEGRYSFNINSANKMFGKLNVIVTPQENAYALLEDGVSALLNEDGSKILLE